jgi:cell division protein FtsB
MNIENRTSNIEHRISNIENRTSKLTAVFLCSLLLLCLPAGCENSKNNLTEQIVTLRDEKLELAHQLEQARAANEQAKRQIQVLSGLSPEVRLENLYDLQKVKITRYTNLYDKDKDGRFEEMIVYLQPVDAEDDIVKASGSVDVQLWDLNKAGDKALLGQWSIAPAELKKMWFATVVTINYRLVFDVSGIVEKFDRPITVKVTFTDYLSGKVFDEQMVIEPAK